MTNGSDGYYLMPLVVIGAAEFIDWDVLVEALMGDQPATYPQIEWTFRTRLRQMGFDANEEWRMWLLFFHTFHDSPCQERTVLSHFERMTLARVCRRIIREAKEKKESNG